MRLARAGPSLTERGSASLREFDRLARHLASERTAVLCDLLHDVAIAIARGELHAAVESRGSSSKVCSTTLMVSTNSRQSIAPRARRLPMLLPMDTWSAACCWFSTCTNCSMVWSDSASCCSIQVSGKASAELWPWSRRANSATKASDRGGFERAMSAITRIRFFGSRLGHRDHRVGPAVGQVLIGARGGDAGGDAAEILDQRQPQHDRDGPQLTQFKGRSRSDRRRRSG
jgi:hypothetical protein